MRKMAFLIGITDELTEMPKIGIYHNNWFSRNRPFPPKIYENSFAKH
jgi:hypothetical protein